jgi:Resolvase, N terminal domain
MLRSGDTLVVRWVDRLGRYYIDVVDTFRDFMRRGVIIRAVINGMTFDGSTNDPMATKSAQRARRSLDRWSGNYLPLVGPSGDGFDPQRWPSITELSSMGRH